MPYYIHIFIIAVALVLGAVAGVKASWRAVAEGEGVPQGQLTLGLVWSLVSVFSATVLYAAYAVLWVWYQLLILPGAY